MIIVCICLAALFAVLFIISIIRYSIKVKAFGYTEKTTAEVVKVKDLTSNPEGKNIRYAVVEYEVEGRRYEHKMIVDALDPELPVGSAVDIVYDVNRPQRSETVYRLQDKKKLKSVWMVCPMFFLLLIVIILIFILPIILDLTENQKKALDNLREMCVCVFWGVTLLIAIKNPDSNLNKKIEHPKLVGYITFALIVAFFGLFTVLMFSYLL